MISSEENQPIYIDIENILPDGFWNTVDGIIMLSRFDDIDSLIAAIGKEFPLYAVIQSQVNLFNYRHDRVEISPKEGWEEKLRQLINGRYLATNKAFMQVIYGTGKESDFDGFLNMIEKDGGQVGQ